MMVLFIIMILKIYLIMKLVNYLKTNFYEKICISQFLINSIYINNENKKVTLYESKVINYYNTVYCDKICNFALTKINNHYFIKLMIYNCCSRVYLEVLELKNLFFLYIIIFLFEI